MRVLMLSRYSRQGASSRLRSYQYIPYLKSRGFDVTVAPLFGDDYVRGLYCGNISKLAVLMAYWKRLKALLTARKYDVVWVEYEILPWMPSMVELGLFPSGIALVVDYDDAIFHRYDRQRLAIVRRLLGAKIFDVMRRADLVVVGNGYLGDQARQAGAKRVELLPTVVDSSRYATIPIAKGRQLTIGWIGSPSGVLYLKQIGRVLREMIDSRGVRVVAVGANPNQLNDLPIEIRPWAEDTEVSEIHQFDIGIMPLPNGDWERGKCGYKLIQYMACGKPVVASPVGVNSVIVRDGVEGFLASTDAEWLVALKMLCDDTALRLRMGECGLARVESEYSLKVMAPRIEQLIRSVVSA